MKLSPGYNFSGRSAYYVASGNLTATTVSNIQKEIMTNGPVKATFDVYEDLYHYSSGVYMVLLCLATKKDYNTLGELT